MQKKSQQTKKTKLTEIKHEQIKQKLQSKQPVKTKKEKKPLSKKESNVDKHELTYSVCKWTSKRIGLQDVDIVDP